jgi:hypothetical protein
VSNRMVLILAAVIAVVVLIVSNWAQGPTLPETQSGHSERRGRCPLPAQSGLGSSRVNVAFDPRRTSKLSD